MLPVGDSMSRIRIEPATAANAAECASILRTTRKHSLPYLPDLHTAEEDVRFLSDRVLADDRVLAALDEAGKVVGFIAFGRGWVNHLYVLPGFQRLGIGRRLLEEAKRQCSGLKLWTFERNTGALRFYESQGFSVVKRTEGTENEEKEPDLLLQWGR